jgi:site-specific recombinase XerD
VPQVRLTQRFVSKAKCPPEARKIDYFDLQLPGFLLEIRATGGKTYYLRYSDKHGAQRQFRIGSATLLTLGQAKIKARDTRTVVELGSDPQGEKAALRNVPRFRDFATKTYLPHAMSYKRSWKTDESMLRTHLLPALGQLHLDEVTPDHIRALLDELRTNGYAPGTISRALILLRHMFNLARKWKIASLTDNPTSGFNAPPDVQRNRFLSRQEADRLIAAIKADENQIAARAILMLLLTGARRNEITHARWDYVDWTERTLLVPMSKNGKARKISLTSAAMDVLDTMKPVAQNGYIFPSPATGRPSPHLFFPWDRIRKRAGLADVRMHDLRHSFASFLINNGASLYRVQRLLGHLNSKSTQRYSHLSAEALAETVQLIDQALGL